MTVYKKPDEFSVPFYIYILQAFYSLATIWKHSSILIMMISKHVTCHLLSREIGKNMSSGQYYFLFQEAANAGRQVGVPLQRLLIVFKL